MNSSTASRDHREEAYARFAAPLYGLLVEAVDCPECAEQLTIHAFRSVGDRTAGIGDLVRYAMQGAHNGSDPVIASRLRTGLMGCLHAAKQVKAFPTLPA